MQTKLSSEKYASQYIDFLTTLLAYANNTAKKLQCEGRFNLTLETLQSISNHQLFHIIFFQLEKAWEAATKSDHPQVVDEKSKDALLQELKNTYYKLQFKFFSIKENFKPFYVLFEEKVKENPERMAVIFENTSWTYQALNEAVNQMAHHLLQLKKEKQWHDNTCIGLFFENSPEAIISILAMMKAGLAYVPLTVDEKLPNERLADYVKISQMPFMITQDKLSHHDFIAYIKTVFPVEICSYKNLIKENTNIENPNLSVKSDQLAYIMFSSGSTGTPKGIKIAHRGLCHPVYAVQKAFQIKPEDRVGWYSLLTFDASLLDIMTALGTGATSVIIPSAIRTNADELTTYLKNHNVTLITLVPSVLESLHPEDFPNLRGFISTGEASQKKLFHDWTINGRLPTSPRIALNGYGPTEVTICTSLGLFKTGENSLHIGNNPIPGLQWFVLTPSDDETPYPQNPQLVKDGEEGELYLAGDGLALGYVDTAAPYQQRFRSIFHPDPNHAGELIPIYQTGDMMKWNAKKNTMEFTERRDDQYKFLGELVHAGAIETALLEYKKDNQPIFSHAKIVMRTSENKLPFLQAYLKKEALISVNLDKKLIRQLYFYLQHHAYCNFIPSRLTIIDKWPTNDRGKLDVKKLPEKTLQTFYASSSFPLLPKKEIEKTIALLWHQILSIPTEEYTIGLDDNFYELGGNSISTNRLLEAVHKIYPEYTKNFAEFNASPTLRNLVFQVQLAKKEVSLPLALWFNGESTWQDTIQQNQYPVTLIHSVTGDVTADYKNIITHWESSLGNWPLLGIRAPSLDNPSYTTRSIQKLASDYIKIMANTLKDYRGPLILIGYSAGGTIAYEMARQMQENKRPAAVYCIDTLSATYYQNLSQEDYASEIYALMQHSATHCMGINDTHHDITKEALQKISKREQLAVYWQNLSEKLVHYSPDNQEKFLGLYNTLNNIIPTQQDYELKPIADVTLLAFSETQKKCHDTRLGWNQAFDIDILPIEGQHLGIISNESWVKKNIIPGIKDFCEQSQKSLKYRQEKLALASTLHGLQKLYQSEHAKIVHPFNENSKMSFDTSYIHLSLLQEKEKEQENKKEDIQQSELNNHKEKTETLVELNDLFSPKNISTPSLEKNQKKVIISGQAGVGKTTLLGYLRFLSTQPSACPDKPAWLNEYDAVLYIPLRLLREYKISSKKYSPNSPEEIARFVHFVFTKEYGEQLDITIEGLYQLIKEFNQNILWLLDGGDEVLSLLAGKDEVAQLAKALCHQPNAIFSTRSITLPQNLFNPTYRYEIMGFNDNNVEQYLTAYLQSVGKIDKKDALLTLLKKETSLWTIAHTPINLAILTVLFSEELEHSDNSTKDNNNTITEIYQKLISFLQKRYLDKQNIDITYAFDKQEALEEYTQQPMHFLENLAFEGMTQQKIIFSPVILKEKLKQLALPLNEQLGFIEKLHGIGLLRWYGNKSQQTENDAYFCHLTFQEFLAARYCAKIIQEAEKNPEAYQKFQELFFTQKFNPQFQVVWWFTSGILSTDEQALQRFFTLLFDEPRDLLGWYETKLFIRCFNECGAPKTLQQSPLIINLISETLEKIICSNDPDLKKSIFPLLKKCQNILKHNEIFIPINDILQGIKSSFRKRAIQLISELQYANQETISILCKIILHDVKKKARKEAILTLGTLSKTTPEIIETLLKAFEIGDYDIRTSSGKALAKCVEKLEENSALKVIETLFQKLENNDEYIKQATEISLTHLNYQSKKISDFLYQIAKTGQKKSKKFACLVLANMGEACVIPIILNSLQNGSDEEKYRSFRLIEKSKLKNKEILQAILEVCEKDTNENIRKKADSLIKTLGTKKRVSPFNKGMRALKIEWVIISQRIIINDEIKNMTWMSKFEEKDVAPALKDYAQKDPEAIQSFVTALKDEDCEKRFSAAITLLKIDLPKNPEIKIQAKDTLLEILDIKNIEYIENFMTNKLFKYNLVDNSIFIQLIKLLPHSFRDHNKPGDISSAISNYDLSNYLEYIDFNEGLLHPNLFFRTKKSMLLHHLKGNNKDFNETLHSNIFYRTDKLKLLHHLIVHNKLKFFYPCFNLYRIISNNDYLYIHQNKIYFSGKYVSTITDENKQPLINGLNDAVPQNLKPNFLTHAIQRTIQATTGKAADLTAINDALKNNDEKIILNAIKSLRYKESLDDMETKNFLDFLMQNLPFIDDDELKLKAMKKLSYTKILSKDVIELMLILAMNITGFNDPNYGIKNPFENLYRFPDNEVKKILFTIVNDKNSMARSGAISMVPHYTEETLQKQQFIRSLCNNILEEDYLNIFPSKNFRKEIEEFICFHKEGTEECHDADRVSNELFQDEGLNKFFQKVNFYVFSDITEKKLFDSPAVIVFENEKNRKIYFSFSGKFEFAYRFIPDLPEITIDLSEDEINLFNLQKSKIIKNEKINALIKKILSKILIEEVVKKLIENANEFYFAKKIADIMLGKKNDDLEILEWQWRISLQLKNKSIGEFYRAARQASSALSKIMKNSTYEEKLFINKIIYTYTDKINLKYEAIKILSPTINPRICKNFLSGLKSKTSLIRTSACQALYLHQLFHKDMLPVLSDMNDLEDKLDACIFDIDLINSLNDDLYHKNGAKKLQEIMASTLDDSTIENAVIPKSVVIPSSAFCCEESPSTEGDSSHSLEMTAKLGMTKEFSLEKRDLSSQSREQVAGPFLETTTVEKKQLGWNCFDIAVNLDRNALILYALQNANQEAFRKLLAPEIRHAAALTAIYMNESKENKKNNQRIIELFEIASALQGLNEVQSINIEIKKYSDKIKEYDEQERHILPKSMHTMALQTLVNNYVEAHEKMRDAVKSSNQALGRPEGNYLSLEELDTFFKVKANQNNNEKTYANFMKVRNEIFSPHEEAFNTYCLDQKTYETYISDYYAKQGWFAFQPKLNGETPSSSMINIAASYLKKCIVIYQNIQGWFAFQPKLNSENPSSSMIDIAVSYLKKCIITYQNVQGWFAFQPKLNGENPSSSMIDIAASHLQKCIVIYQNVNGVWKEIYQTAAYGPKLGVEYNGYNHFMSLNISSITTATSSKEKNTDDSENISQYHPPLFSAPPITSANSLEVQNTNADTTTKIHNVSI